MFCNSIYEWLEAALDIGIKENEFWNMTYAEIDRAIESYKRVKERNDREKASYDYILADLIGRSISRVYNSSNKMPAISEAYPNLFSSEEEQAAIQQKKQELSVVRFQAFAHSFNKRFEGVSKNE